MQGSNTSKYGGCAVLSQVKRRVFHGKLFSTLCLCSLFFILISSVNRNHRIMKDIQRKTAYYMEHRKIIKDKLDISELEVNSHDQSKGILMEENSNGDQTINQIHGIPRNPKDNGGSGDKDIEQIHEERRRKLRETCAGRENEYIGNSTKDHVRSRILIGPQQNVAYCSIQKIGSTFWKRVFKIVTGKSDAENPFDLKPGAATGTKFEKLVHLPEEEVQPFMKKSTKFLFVREPYARLFSGYGDKLFSPNTFFWGMIGTYAIQLVRTNADDVSLKCGHNLTFAEFVKYVIHAEQNNIKRNGHFSPAYDHCQPCRYKYDIIGKLETIKDDTLYILDRIGQTDLKESLMKNFGSGTVQDTITDQVGWLFGLRKRYVGCMTFYDAQRRMWKKFQMRGIISKYSKYPVTEKQSEFVTREEYTKYVYDGMGDAKDRTVAKRNKEEAMVEAYSTVDKNDLEKLSKIFKPDCDLFGYDCRPDKIFKQTTGIEPWYLDITTA